MAAVSRATARAVPVSRSEEKGTAAGTDTVTASGQVVRRCSSIDPVAASSSGLPSGRVRAGFADGGGRGPGQRGAGQFGQGRPGEDLVAHDHH